MRCARPRYFIEAVNRSRASNLMFWGEPGDLLRVAADATAAGAAAVQAVLAGPRAYLLVAGNAGARRPRLDVRALALLGDVLAGELLGEQAARLCVLGFIVLRFRPRLRFFPMWQQALAVLALLLNDRVS